MPKAKQGLCHSEDIKKSNKLKKLKNFPCIKQNNINTKAPPNRRFVLCSTTTGKEQIMRILLTVIFGSAFLFSCTKNPTGSAGGKGLAACKQFEKDFTFGAMAEASTSNGKIMPKNCQRAKTGQGRGDLTVNTPCEPEYIACVAMGAIGASADDKTIVFLYDEAGKTMAKNEACDKKDQKGNSTIDCDWYQD